MTETLAAKAATFPADMPDWQVADALNAPDAAQGTRNVDVPVPDVRALLMVNGFWGGICLAADDAAQPVNVRSLCITVRDSMLNLTTLLMSQPAYYASIKGMADNLLALNLTDQATHDAMMALCVATNSWADVNNAGQPVTSRDVGLARGSKA